MEIFSNQRTESRVSSSVFGRWHRRQRNVLNLVIETYQLSHRRDRFWVLFERRSPSLLHNRDHILPSAINIAAWFQLSEFRSLGGRATPRELLSLVAPKIPLLSLNLHSVFCAPQILVFSKLFYFAIKWCSNHHFSQFVHANKVLLFHIFVFVDFLAQFCAK